MKSSEQWAFVPQLGIQMVVTVDVSDDSGVVTLWDVAQNGEPRFGDIIGQISRYTRRAGRQSEAGTIVLGEEVSIPFGIYRNAERLEVELFVEGKLYVLGLVWRDDQPAPTVACREGWTRVS